VLRRHFQSLRVEEEEAGKGCQCMDLMVADLWTVHCN